MTAPKEVFVATATGVYHTTDFDAPGQPTWALIPNGIVPARITVFQADPFAPSHRQYVGVDGEIYRRTGGGSWELILDTAQARAIAGVTIGRPVFVFCDMLTQGVVWVLHTREEGIDWDRRHQWALRSADYGATWTSFSWLGTSIYTYFMGGIAARGDWVVATANDSFAFQSFHFSANDGQTWTRRHYGGSTMNPCPDISPYMSGTAYAPGLGGTYRLRDNAVTQILPFFNGAYGPMPPAGLMWFNPHDPLHMRYVNHTSIEHTTDDWATRTSQPFTLEDFAVCAPIANTQDTDLMIVGRGRGPHIVTIASPTATTYTHRAGANWNVFPYAGSIPTDAGRVASRGVYAVPIVPPPPPPPPPPLPPPRVRVYDVLHG